MATEQRDYQVIADIGSNLLIIKIGIDRVIEQDVNARIMRREMQDQLTANIANRGQLESLPFLVQADDKIQIISGHHRIQSARAAGLTEIYAILDVSGLTRSQIVAKQLAHNTINGFDDQETMKKLVEMITEVDDMIESFVGKDIMEEPMKEFEKMTAPAMKFDFKNVTFTFLPHQIKDLNMLIENLESTAPDVIGVAAYDQCRNFVETLTAYQKFMEIKNIGAAIHSMIECCKRDMELNGFEEDDEGWTYMSKLFGSGGVPAEAGDTIRQALKKAEKEGIISKKNKWQLIEYLCADYLSGIGD